MITCVVPCYNAADTIIESLSSLKNQTEKSFEVIIVNDGSTDNSEELITEYIRDDHRFKLYSKENGGLSDARNYGLRYCESEYICFLDGDDVYEENLFKILSREIQNSGSDIYLFKLKRLSNFIDFPQQQSSNVWRIELSN